MASTRVIVDSRAFYIGPKANYKFKWKDILTLKADKGCVFFDRADTRVELVNADEQSWDKFQSYLEKRWMKSQYLQIYLSKEVIDFVDFFLRKCTQKDAHFLHSDK